MQRRWPVAALLAVALVVRIAAGEFFLARGAEQLPDSELYRAYAQRIFRGEEYVVTNDGARRAPGYPIFLSACWLIVGRESDRIVVWAQAVVSTLGCLFVYQMGRLSEVAESQMGSGAIALAFAAFDPYAVALCALLLSETLFGVLLLATALAAVSAHQGRTNTRWMIVGALFGAAVLVRPSVLLLGPAAAAVYVFTCPNRGQAALAAGVALSAAALVMSPWWARNAHRYGAFVATTLNVGESLYDGLNPAATGASNMEFRADQPVDLDERVADAYWRSAAVAFVRANPGRVIELAVVKFRRFWAPWPNEPRFQRPEIVAATTAATVPIWILALSSLWSRNARSRWSLLLLLPALYFCILHMIFVSSVRYRVPIQPFLMIPAASAASALLTKWRPFDRGDA